MSEPLEDLNPYSPSFVAFAEDKGPKTRKPSVLSTGYNVAVSSLCAVASTAYERTFNMQSTDEKTAEELAFDIQTQADKMAVALVTAAKQVPTPIFEPKKRLSFFEQVSKKFAQNLAKYNGTKDLLDNAVGVLASKYDSSLDSRQKILRTEDALKGLARTMDYVYYNDGKRHEVPDLTKYEFEEIMASSSEALNDVGFVHQFVRHNFPTDIPSYAMPYSVRAANKGARLQYETEMLIELAKFIDQVDDKTIPIIRDSEAVRDSAENAKEKLTVLQRLQKMYDALSNIAAEIQMSPTFLKVKYWLQDTIQFLMYHIRPLDKEEKLVGAKKPYVKPVHEDLIAEPGFEKQRHDVEMAELLDATTSPTIMGAICRGLIKLDRYFNGAEREKENTQNFINLKLRVLAEKQAEWNNRIVVIMQLLDEVGLLEHPGGIHALVNGVMNFEDMSKEDAYKAIEDRINYKLTENAPKAVVERLRKCFADLEADLYNHDLFRQIINDFCVLTGKVYYIGAGAPLESCQYMAAEIGIDGIELAEDEAKILSILKGVTNRAIVDLGIENASEQALERKPEEANVIQA